jgi:predicted RNA-binding protein with TRAM domain
MLNLSDYQAYGQIYKCLKENPKLSNREIALSTKLSIMTILKFRLSIESDLGLPAYSGDEIIAAQQTQTTEKPRSLPQIEGQGKRLIIYKKSCPVSLRGEYIGKITKKSQSGAGIAFIEGYPCEIPGAFSEEVVKFRIEKIAEVQAFAKLIQVIERPIKVEKTIYQPIVEKPESATAAYDGKRCINCNFPVTDSHYDIYDGFCMKCYYNKIQSDDAIGMRRSGTYGSDRAGTW